MRKEVILAVIIGILLGGVVLYGINLANKSASNTSDGKETTNDQPETVEGLYINSDNQVSIIYPQNNSVLVESQITLKGSSKPNSNIAIISENDDIITTADENGAFSSEISLINGENVITITSVDENLATASSSIIIIRTISLPE